jgi:hypothetical protein
VSELFAVQFSSKSNCLRFFYSTIINRRHLHLEGTLYRVIGLAHLEDPECYAGRSVATGRISLAGQDEGEKSDEERYPAPPGWGLRRWTSTPMLANLFLS